jgi:putative phosphoribosyl transferase
VEEVLMQHLGQTITISEHALEGDLVIPPGARAIILFAHGSGSSRHSTRNQYVARVLNEAGFATLLVDLLTLQEKVIDQSTRHVRYDINLLAGRLMAVTRWILENPSTHYLHIGYFGSSTGATAALTASSKLNNTIKAIVSRGGRPDLIPSNILPSFVTPVLFIVGGNDASVLAVTVDVMKRLSVSRKELVVISGAGHMFEEEGKMEEVAKVTAQWFEAYLLENGKKFESKHTQNAKLLSLKQKFNIHLRFNDRAAAGSILASVLSKHTRPASELIVIGIPRGGVVVADVIAQKLHSKLDMVFPRKLRVPDNPENAAGAVMQDGSIYLDDEIIGKLQISPEYLEMEKKEQMANIHHRMSRYRPAPKEYALSSKTVILADDGAATGSTIIAAARWIRKVNPSRLIIALPVAPKQVVQKLKREADFVEALREPSKFGTVAQYYVDYRDIEDEQIIQIMKSY